MAGSLHQFSKYNLNQTVSRFHGSSMSGLGAQNPRHNVENML